MGDDDDSPGVDGGGGSDGGDDPDGGSDPDGPPQPDAPPAPLRVCADGSGDFTTIGAAVAAAPDGGLVQICGGVFPERLTIGDKSLRLEGAGADATIIDAGGAGIGVNVFGGHDVVLAALTVKNGRNAAEGGAIRCTDARLQILDGAVLDSRAEAGGGGVFGSNCPVTINNTRFSGNEGRDRGGAILLLNGSGSITASQFTGNSADYGGAAAFIEGNPGVFTSTFTGNTGRVRGGAVYQMSDGVMEDSVVSANHAGWTGGGVHVNMHAPTFRRSMFTGNDAAWEGGGFYLHQAHAVIEDNLIDGNRAFDDGGGLRIFESAARLERNMISNNVSEDGDGGGWKCSHVASTYIDNMVINNDALGAGGGFELDNDSSHVHGGVVSGNHASIGGGIHVMLWPWSGGYIEDVRILDNEAHRGGGIYIENNFQPVTVRRIWVEGNEAHQGAGVYTRGTMLRLSNSTIINNEAGDVGGGFFSHPSSQYPWTHECPCPPIDPPADISFTTFHGNVADNGAGAWIGSPNLTFRNSIFSGHATSTVMVGDLVPSPAWSHNDTMPATFMNMSNPTGSNGNISSDPSFVAAAAGDFHLAAGSACIDAAEPAMTDHDGSRADLGAFGGPDAP